MFKGLICVPKAVCSPLGCTDLYCEKVYDLEDRRECCYYAGVCSVIFCSCYEANTFIGLFKTVAGKEISAVASRSMICVP